MTWRIPRPRFQVATLLVVIAGIALILGIWKDRSHPPITTEVRTEAIVDLCNLGANDSAIRSTIASLQADPIGHVHHAAVEAIQIIDAARTAMPIATGSP